MKDIDVYIESTHFFLSGLKTLMTTLQILDLYTKECWETWQMSVLWPKSECESISHSVMSDSLRPHGLLCPWDSPAKNTGVGCHSLLQGIFPIQGSNLGHSALQVDSLPAEAQRELISSIPSS